MQLMIGERAERRQTVIWARIAYRWSVAVLALGVITGAACEPGAKGATASPEASPAKQAAASPAQASPTGAAVTSALLPKSCRERVSDAAVTTALGKPVQMTKQVPDGEVLLCLYDAPSASPNPIGFAGRVIYSDLGKKPSRQDVDAYINGVNEDLHGAFKAEETSGLGDYSAWVTVTIPDYRATAWMVIATKGSLMVEFTTQSQFTQADKTKMQAVVRMALG